VTQDPGDELHDGDRVGDRYTVRSRISSGAMGAVYKARTDDELDVALKRLTDRSQEARFEIEARLLARLRHPRVVRVIDYLQEASGQYLVMEHVVGPDLGTVLERDGRPGLPVSEAVEHGQQACEALQYVHEQNLVHRDVKPRNLILSDSGVTLVDFGIARELAPRDPGTRAVGTPLYMAPEVLVGEDVSPRSDVYGLAATIWALLSGSPPGYGEQKPLTDAAPGVSAELERTLRQALALRPERRVASVQALAAALGSPLGLSTGDSLAISLPQTTTPRGLLEAIVRAAAGVFDAAAASVALVDAATGELLYQAAWGAGAEEIVGVRLQAGAGLGGVAVSSGEGIAVPDCRGDPRFAAQIAAGTGYVPHTMLIVPLIRDGRTIGALSVLDRRDGAPYSTADVPRAELFADLAVTALPPTA
jgi:tRNA A-37 threonylcarbamoyl transferase component Bud32